MNSRTRYKFSYHKKYVVRSTNISNITLYAYTFRSRAERVLWVLKELNLPHRIIRINPFEHDHINPEILALNPDGKVPILVHDKNILLESLAIMEYLNGISQTGGLVPHDNETCYQFRKKLHYGLTEIEPYLWLAEQSNGPLANYYYWPSGVYQESINRVKTSCRKVQQFVTDEYFMLENGFSIADIYFYHILTWAKQHGVEHDSKLEYYLQTLENRPAFPKAMYWKS